MKAILDGLIQELKDLFKEFKEFFVGVDVEIPTNTDTTGVGASSGDDIKVKQK